MTAPSNLDAKRHELRQKMQRQRDELKSIFNLTPPNDGDAYPRSMTLRLLTGQSTWLMIIIMKLLPLLLKLRK